MADWAGKTLGKIHIEQLVARGGMAEVYVGTHESFGQVAVKILRGLLEQDSAQVARFKREAEVIASLKHPHIVQMLDYYVVDETPCLVMEYISGPSLASYLKVLRDRKQQLPIGIIANLVAALASALDYAHDKGIVHRDIKPANVLLRSPSQDVQTQKTLPFDVQPVLTDFGLVRILDSTMHTTAGSVAGTPAYMSPEQARGEKVDKRTDIYSLGIMLYEMLSGSVPFQADTTFGMLMQHINEQPAPIKGISPDLQAVLYRALAKDPALRYQTAGDLANEFIAIFNGQTVSPGTLHIAQLAQEAAAEDAAAKSQPAERPRNRWLRLGAEFAITAAVVGALFFLIFRPNNVDPNAPVGRMRFTDFVSPLDRVSFSLPNITPPENGTHYQAWLVGNNGKAFRDLGTIAVDPTGSGSLTFTEPNNKNLLEDYDQVQITSEKNDISVAEPTGQVVYSSVFPPEALVYVRNVLVSFEGIPENWALMQALYYRSGSWTNVPINGDPVNDPEYVGLVKAYENNDERTLRRDTEQVINQIVGDLSEQFQDYDKSGEPDVYSDDTYGSLPKGDRPGYFQLTALHLKNAAEAPDSTPNIREQSGNIQVCIQNMQDWTNQLLPLALQLSEMPFGPDMKPIIDQMSALGRNLVQGVDTNANGQIEPIAGECGADKAYEYGWYMADFPIFSGPDRIPPTGEETVSP